MAGRFELLGVPTSAGAHGPGQEKAPAALRKAGLREALQSAGLTVDDGGDLATVRFEPDPGNRKAQSAARVTAVASSVADRVAVIAADGKLPLVLGGDCTISLGVISGLLRVTGGELGLLYLDGDIDLNTPGTTRSGIMDNMGVANMVAMAETPLARIGPRAPLLEDERIVIFGYDPGEQEAVQLDALAGRRIRHFPSTEVSQDPTGRAREAIEALSVNKRVLLHFDVDTIDSTELPLADFPHFNAGLSIDHAMAALHEFIGMKSLAGVVLTEINPDHDPDAVIIRDFVGRLAAAFS